MSSLTVSPGVGAPHHNNIEVAIAVIGFISVYTAGFIEIHFNEIGALMWSLMRNAMLMLVYVVIFLSSAHVLFQNLCGAYRSLSWLG
jgi:hypothetical protein